LLENHCCEENSYFSIPVPIAKSKAPSWLVCGTERVVKLSAEMQKLVRIRGAFLNEMIHHGVNYDDDDDGIALIPWMRTIKYQ
jgi:hypothetical protein